MQKPPGREDLKAVLARIDALMAELAALRDKLHAAQQGEMKPPEPAAERRQGNRRRVRDRRR